MESISRLPVIRLYPCVLALTSALIHSYLAVLMAASRLQNRQSVGLESSSFSICAMRMRFTLSPSNSSLHSGPTSSHGKKEIAAPILHADHHFVRALKVYLLLLELQPALLAGTLRHISKYQRISTSYRHGSSNLDLTLPNFFHGSECTSPLFKCLATYYDLYTFTFSGRKWHLPLLISEHPAPEHITPSLCRKHNTD